MCYIFMPPDADWLNDESRVYPITIDPQVTTSSDAKNIIDNYVMENSGVQTYTLDRLYIGKKNGNRTRAFVKFTNMPTIPSGSTITDTKMTFWLTAGQSTGSNASAYMVIGGDWSSSTITWANMPNAPGPVSVNISHNNLTKYEFSCTYAVRTWYTGSTTGQNKNYGIMLRYYDESINDCNPVYSADYTTASKRPSLTITYQVPNDNANVLEGATHPLNDHTISGTISWSSDNVNVATVNSNGQVTGIKAGKATISASVDGTVQKTYIVYVTIPSGVYSIKSMSTNFYLGTYGGISENTNTRLLSKSSDGLSQVQQLWKITYLDSGYYSIRPMHKLDMGLTVASKSAVISSISTEDTIASVPLVNRWTIQYNASGYQFLHTGTISQALCPADGTSSPGLGVTVAVGQSSNTFRWTISKLSSPPSGAYLYDTSTDGVVNYPTKYVVKGQSKTLSDYNLLPISYSRLNNIQSFTWDVEDDDSQYVAVNASTGKVTGKSAGTATIIGAGTGGSVKIRIVVLPFADGTYYLKNRHTGTYATLFSSTLSAGDTITHTQLTTSITQKWVLNCLDDGTYYIKPKTSSSVTYYLGVATSTADIILTTTPTRWRIETTSRGAFKFTAYTASSKAIAIPYVETGLNMGDGVLLQLFTYSNDSNLRDEWLVYSQAPSYHATVNTYYDFGYPAYYNESEADGAEHIDAYMQVVANRYMELYSLDITAPGSTYLSSDVDACKGTISQANIDALCAHPAHHTELSTLQTEITLKKTGNRTTTSVFWSGHKITSDLYGDNRSISWLYYVLLLERSIQEERDRDSASVLMHELNHQFGASDHYHDPEDPNDEDSPCRNKAYCSRCGDNKRPASCIMNLTRMDISDDNVLCDACKQEILAHLEEHHKS